MRRNALSHSQRDRYLLLTILYEGPFERLLLWVARSDPEDGTWRDWVINRLDDLDHHWRVWYIRHHLKPHPRWRRSDR